MKLFKKLCDHEWKILMRSNALQFDSMGYPLRLCYVKCVKCGETKHMWIDVPVSQYEEIKTGESVLVTWLDPIKE